MWLLIEYNYLYKTKLMWSAEKQNLNQNNHKFPIHHIRSTGTMIKLMNLGLF
jgi:hypothetical protein